jgi:hypothetical protein
MRVVEFLDIRAPNRYCSSGPLLHTKSPAGSAKLLDLHFFVVEEIDCSPSADVTPTCFAITVYSHVGESHFRALPLACAAHSKCYGKVCRMSYKDDSHPTTDAVRTGPRVDAREARLQMCSLPRLQGNLRLGRPFNVRSLNSTTQSQRAPIRQDTIMSRRGAIPQPRLGPARVPAI